MHIPDGYLSPQTYVPLFGASAAMWAVALRKIKRDLSAKQVPYLAMAAAFSFVIMMFNIPIPGGTTGHAVGGAIIAILLGPWTAVIAVSVVMIIQAVVFADGGISAIGANCFNMAVVMPFTAYWTFMLVRGNARTGRRVYIAAFLAGYVGLVVAAVVTGIEFGIQPIIAHGPDGAPLYSPYPLSVALPAMALEHMFLFGLVEGAVTALVIKYFSAHETEAGFGMRDSEATAFRRRLWYGIAGLALLSPIGILLPKLLGANGAWGEWGAEDLSRMIGFVPEGMKKLGSIWNAPIADYGLGGGGAFSEYAEYIFSAVVGILLVALSGWLIARMVRKEDQKPPDEPGRHKRHGGPGKIPEFLLESHRGSDITSGKKLSTPFLDKGIHHLAHSVRTAYAQWETASRSGMLQKIDPRVKVIFLIFFIVVVSIKSAVLPGIVIAACIFALAAASKLELIPFYRRIFFLAFLFGFLIAAPSSLNLISGGSVVVPLVSLSRPYELWIYRIPQTIGLTDRGLYGMSVLTLRVFNSVTLSLLVLYTTPFNEIVRALKVFRVPDAFIVTVTLAYRYIFLFARTVEEMHLARKSRLIGMINDEEARKWIAGRMVVMFKKAILRCEEIYSAMLSRGFSGELRVQGFPRAVGRDYMFAIGSALVGVGVLFL